MKPFHRNNTLFFFKLYPRTNGSLFFSGKTRFGLSSSEAFIWGTSPTSTPLIISELLRGWGGGGEVDRNLQPAPGGDPRPGSGDAWSWDNSGWGYNEGRAFVSGQSVGEEVREIIAPGPCPTPKQELPCCLPFNI